MPEFSIDYTRPFVYDYQKQIMDSVARFTFTEASTKVGKTASHIIWLFEQALEVSVKYSERAAGKSVWWVAPVYAQARIAYERMKLQVESKGQEGMFFKSNDTALSLTLPTGVMIQFKSAEKPDNLYGDDVYAAVFDEFTRARETAWFALRSTLTKTRGKCKFIGNVKGTKNWGYKLCFKARTKGIGKGGDGSEPDLEYFKITCWDGVASGLLEMDEIEGAMRDLPPDVFRELYEAEASDDGCNPFGLKAIAACTWDMSKLPAHVYGIDLARKNDYFVSIGLDKTGAVCELLRYNKTTWFSVKKSILGLPNKPTAIDATGAGDPIVEEVKTQRSNVEAFVFTNASKQMLMEGLAFAIQNKEVSFPDGVIKDELEMFEFKYTTRGGVTYSAPSGHNDDCVCALALAWHKFKQHRHSGSYSLAR